MMKKDSWLSCLKGIGIILVVMGHTALPTTRYIYMFHLALFFFAAGYSYNPQKYEANWPKLVASRIGSIMPPYFTYNIIALLLHNVFISMGIIDIALGGNVIGFTSLFTNALNIISLHFTAQFCGPMWFLAPWLFAISIYAVIVSICTKLAPTLSNLKKRQILISIICILCGAVGIFLVQKNVYVYYHIQTSMLMLPVVCAGSIYKSISKGEKHFGNIFGFIISLFILIFFTNRYAGCLDLSQNNILSPYTFYIFTFAGIYCIMCLAKLVNQYLPVIKKLLTIAGNYSFDIMATHFLFFKLIDFICYNVMPAENMPNFVLSKFPASFNYGPILFLYVIVGIIFPILLRFGFNKAFEKCKSTYHILLNKRLNKEVRS